MVGINDLLGLSLLVIASSTILKPGRNIPYSYNLSQLSKFVQTGYRYETYSPRVRGIIMRKKGYDPIDYGAIERGKKASGFIPGIQNIINTLDQNILKLNKSYSSLESI